MKKFIYSISRFSLVAFVIFLALECLSFAFPNEYSYKRNYVEDNSDRIKILILGQSHAGKGINPEAFGDSVFNMAMGGRIHFYDAVLAERYVSRLKNLKCVIWPLGYSFEYHSYLYPDILLSKEHVNAIEMQQCMYEKYMGISYEKAIPYLHCSQLAVYPFGYKMSLLPGNFEKKIGGNRLGYEKIPLSKRSCNWQESMLPSIIDYSHPEAPKARQEGICNFKRIAAACRKANVRLVVISTPCNKTYQRRMTERGKREMLECVDSMKSVYPDMEYYNFIADTRFTDEDFFDASHLCDKGAEKFSKIIRDTLHYYLPLIE